MAFERIVASRQQSTSPFAGWVAGIEQWVRDGMRRRQDARALRQVPDHLRKDLGLDGGAKLADPRFSGRSFIQGGCPDSTLSGWRW